MERDRPDDSDDPALDGLLRRLAGAPAVVEFEGTDRFQVLRRLGAGGFGAVYLVRDLASSAEVALKALTVLQPELLFRLKQEFRALAGLRHPNLVAFYELFAEGERCYFTMAHVPGRTFLEHVRGPAGLDDARLRGALGQLAAGLGALHGAGKLHRDLKPANVLVDHAGHLVILDFGLATEIGGGPGVLEAGTPEYMSPESLDGAPPTPAADWYSVGVMLHQALCGRRPHRGSTTDLVAQRRRAEPLPFEPLDPAAAPDLVALCRRLLAPDPAIRAGLSEVLAAAGRTAPAEPPWPAAPQPVTLVGRTTELARLEAALAGAGPGAATTVLVEGPSGSGKTTLVRHLLERAAGRGAVALAGRCYERERVPYPGVDSLVEDLCRFLSAQDRREAGDLLPADLGALVTLFPVLGRVEAVAARRLPERDDGLDPHELRKRAFGALRDLLGRVALRHRLAVHIDDLQWCDADTVALLLDLLRPPDAPGLLLVLSYRSERLEANGPLAALIGGLEGAAVRLPLGPLGPEEARALAGQLLGPGRGGAELSAVVAEAGGNPFFLLELARFLARHGPAEAAGRLDLKLALRERIEALPASARALLDAVAVAGHPLPEAVARRAAALEGPPWEFWTHLVAAGLVRFLDGSAPGVVEVHHDRILQAVLAGLAPDRVVDCHRHLARALEAHGGADPEVLARHHEAAGDASAAFRAAVAAAAQAEQALAFDRAARLFQWALRLSPGGGLGRGALLVALGRTLANGGRGLEAAAAFREAAALAGPVERNGLERQAALELLASGRIDAGRDLFIETLRGVGLGLPRTPRRALASLLWRTVLDRTVGPRRRAALDPLPARIAAQLDHLHALAQGLTMVDVVRGAEAGARLLFLAHASGDAAWIARARAVWAGHQGVLEPWAPRSARAFARAGRLVAATADHRAEVLLRLARAAHLQSRGPWAEALASARDAQRAYTEHHLGLSWETWTARTFEVWALFHLGRWRELSERLERHLPEAQDRGNVYATTAMRVPFGVTAWLARGDVAGARQQVREAVEGWSVRGFQLQHYWFVLGACLVDLHDGRGTAAWTRVRDRWPELRGSMLLRLPIVRTHMLHLRGACAIAAAGEAAGEAEREALLGEAVRAAAGLRRIGSPMARLQGLLLLAAEADARGQDEEAALGYAEALRGLDAEGLAPYAAAARFRLARLHGRHPDGLDLPGADLADPEATARMLLPGGRRARR